ncbi:MAG: response regulator [Candidatus Marinimicrobia bacterium]|nr:response regulator [Candidatus Neomarinimicrobiota bacterium]MCF7851183.1 response regulator [Candidatus Neomarinimicrobiota bacterium]MCF7904234.1 response regulator [Candidatus Neomarinimicrobiota bacterium]
MTELKPLGKLLIVEDDVSLTKYLRELFDMYFEIRVAHDGQTGFELARIFEPDCIISDVRMPRLSGINMVKKIRQTEGLETVGVILLTVLSDKKDRVRAFDNQVDLYFTKPFDSDELVSATMGLVMMRQKMRQIYAGNALPEDDQKGLTEADETFLHRLSDVVEEHISEFSIKIDDIASATGTSVDELEDKINELEGVTPYEFFMQVKLEHAKKLADSGKITSLDKLAYEVGFIDTETFLRKFQKYFGYPLTLHPLH